MGAALSLNIAPSNLALRTVFPKKRAEFSRRFFKIIGEPALIEAELSTTGNTQLNSRSIRNNAALGVSPVAFCFLSPILNRYLSED
jgi:hypothetical protein